MSSDPDRLVERLTKGGTDPQRLGELQELLEGRRRAIDAAMWQVPGLTMAGQAFLLPVIANKSVSFSVALLAALAGIAATVAAGVALWQQVALERMLNGYVAAIAEDQGLGRTRNTDLWRPHELSQAIRRAWLIWLSFGAVLVLFAAADVFAVATR